MEVNVLNANIYLERGLSYTQMFDVAKNDELTHHGILGQKWGIRRYQNEDGSLTKAGMRRYGTLTNFKKVQAAEKKAKSDAIKAKYKSRTEADIAKIRKKYKLDQENNDSSNKKSKKISEMTDDEVRAKINRIRLENELKSLTPKQISRGEKLKKELGDIAISALKSAGKVGMEAAEKYIKKELNKALGIKDTEAISKKLKQEADDLQNKVKIMNARRQLEREQNERNNSQNTGNSNSRNSENSNQNNNSRSNQSNNVRTTYPNSENTGNSTQTNNRSASNSNSNSQNTGNSTQTNNRSASNSNFGYGWNNRDAEFESNASGERRSGNTNNLIDIDYTEMIENHSSFIDSGENYVRAFLRDPNDND